MTTESRRKYWSRWKAYVAPLGVDPYLQNTAFALKARVLSGYAARVRSGYYGRGWQIRADSVSAALTAVGTVISLATGINRTKEQWSDKLIPRLAQMLYRWKKYEPPTIKKLPVEADIPELRRPHDYSILLPLTCRRVHNQKQAKQHETNRPIPYQRHNILQTRFFGSLKSNIPSGRFITHSICR